MKTQTPIAFLASLALALPALASQPIDQTRAVDATARVEVSNVKGTLTVSGWDRNEVHITGTLGDGSKGLSIEGDHGHLVIKVEPPDQQGMFSWGADTHMGDSVLDVKVPHGARLKLGTVSADLTVGGIDGDSLEAATVSGEIDIDSRVKRLDADSVSGDMAVAGGSEHAHLQTVSGDIRAHGLGGEVKFDTVSGNVDAQIADYRDLDAGSVSGDIALRGSPTAGAHIGVNSMSGDVHLSLPASVSARFDASTFSGSIRSDFGTSTHPEHGPGSHLNVTVGSGDAQVKLETFSGDISIRRN
jgi:DUF4097 and DUF4098 domain-containing protein YvlB